jgi:acetylornithine deacetylase/succinyl-diaminopimelate desuccinylase-like protein
MPATLDDALRVADQSEVREPIVRFLVDLLRVETTVGPDVEAVRAREEQAFGLISQAAETFLGSSRDVERVPIDPRIEADPYYTPVHYTKTRSRPGGLSAADAYRGRSNLVVRLPGQGRGVLAFNAHIDVVAPFIPPRLEGPVLYGRGACDDKGQCAVMLLALCLIEHARWMGDLVPPADLLFEFVIDEEPGGNGSLSLALDRRFAFDALVVLEATKLGVHPGNRGAVWYRVELDGSAAPGLDLVGLAGAVVLALEEEGAKLKAESDHPLFPRRPVQTCHGILGPWGKHPSAVNDHVELALAGDGVLDQDRLAAAIDEAVAAYCAVYGDKTKEPDPATGQPKVDHHYDLARDKDFRFQISDFATVGAGHAFDSICNLQSAICNPGDAMRLTVHGKAGHMGAILQCDDAITKAAYILRALEAAPGLRIRRFAIAPASPAEPLRSLVLEGGQGFLPTHSLAEVTRRMRSAAERGAEAYCRSRGAIFVPGLVRTTFDKLHNDAFARDPSRPAVRAFVEAARRVGIEVREPLRGWDVSCDARVFAREYPESDIITFGAGELEHAHSAQEQVRVGDIVAAAKAVARFALTYAPRP